MKTLLKKYFGFDEFRPLQEKIINAVMNNEDVFVLMPTGGGKSLCYQLPALKFKGLTLVVSPLIALMKDQVDMLQKNGIAAEYINSTIHQSEISRIQYQAKDGKIKLLYIAPERLAARSFQLALQTLSVSLIAIDEAHCISEWGHDFRPDYRNLGALRQAFPKAPIIALTATATPRVQEDIITHLSLRSPKKFVASFDRENLTFIILKKKNAFDKLVRLLNQHKNQSAIIYCFSRKDTENIATALGFENFKAVAYHAGLSSEDRRRAQELFIKDEVDIIVATIAFGMGIDKPDIRLIVHYTFPKTVEGYYQEIGRAGRDGLPSECVTLYTIADKRKHEYFINQIEDPVEQGNVRKKLNQVIEYFEQPVCRRKQILHYFGEQYLNANCGACDICLNANNTFDATEITQKILSCVFKTGQRFGKKYIADVLIGRKDGRIIARGHDKLSVFGIAGDFVSDDLARLIGLIVSHRLLEIYGDEYPMLKITRDGFLWLKQRKTIALPCGASGDSDQNEERGLKQTLDYDEALFQELRALRKKIASAESAPPYVIFGDVSLQEMAYFLPIDKDHFLKIKGVGAMKGQTYGDAFLSVIRAYIQEKGLEPKDIPRVRQRRLNTRTIAQKSIHYAKTKEMLQRKLPLSEIAESQGLKESTIMNHIESIINGGEFFDLSYLLPKLEDCEKIKTAFDACGYELLKPVYDMLGERYSYDEIRMVRLDKKARELNFTNP